MNRFVFTDNKILDEVKKYCNDHPHLNADYLFEDIKATALLREIGNDRYAFTHLTIQEYLAATILVKDENLAKLFCQAYFDPIICEMEVLPMTLGLYQYNVNANKENLYGLLEKLPESLNFANLRLRAKGLSYFKVNEKYVSQLADRLIEFIIDKNIDERIYKEIVINAFSGLCNKNRELISRRLSELLNYDKLSLAFFSISNIIYALVQLQAKEAIPELIPLLKHEDSGIRRDVATALGQLQAKEAIPELIAMLRDEDSSICRDVAIILEQYDRNLLINGILLGLSHNDVFVRKKSISVIGYYSFDENIKKKLEEITTTDPYEEIRNIANIELEKLQLKLSLSESSSN
ncbi:MAG TPA: HEAT repeat domain-containing protein [Nitrososphaeraceae archaeon]|nr:HEAT repeat domain-containing protein [Nitrososphaeraceae archaeon]